jgi:hypothetical protein
MAVRIRYSASNEASVLESKRMFHVDSNGVTTKYRVRININELSFVVFDADSEVIAVSGTGSTLAILKKRVKLALNDLGYTFASESRDRRPEMGSVPGVVST